MIETRSVALSKKITFKEEYLVEVQGVEPLSLAGNDGSPAEVVVMFGQLDGFM